MPLDSPGSCLFDEIDDRFFVSFRAVDWRVAVLLAHLPLPFAEQVPYLAVGSLFLDSDPTDRTFAPPQAVGCSFFVAPARPAGGRPTSFWTPPPSGTMSTVPFPLRDFLRFPEHAPCFFLCSLRPLRNEDVCKRGLFGRPTVGEFLPYLVGKKTSLFPPPPPRFQWDISLQSVRPLVFFPPERFLP